ncbi:hypothetical protein J6590_006680 [Homalodisca vitripennis]|nr:hypothetical protein J6590_006680 [Homalodisca vitripennis]
MEWDNPVGHNTQICKPTDVTSPPDSAHMRAQEYILVSLHHRPQNCVTWMKFVPRPTRTCNPLLLS